MADIIVNLTMILYKATGKRSGQLTDLKDYCCLQLDQCPGIYLLYEYTKYELSGVQKYFNKPFWPWSWEKKTFKMMTKCWWQKECPLKSTQCPVWRSVPQNRVQSPHRGNAIEVQIAKHDPCKCMYGSEKCWSFYMSRACQQNTENGANRVWFRT